MKDLPSWILFCLLIAPTVPLQKSCGMVQTSNIAAHSLRSINPLHFGLIEDREKFGKSSSYFPKAFFGYKGKKDWDQALIAGRGLVFSTYLGSNEGDHSSDVAVDSEDNIYVLGYTWSSPYSPSDFPTTAGAYDTSFNGEHDIVITKLDKRGSIIYSTFLGGRGNDWGHAIVADLEQNVYIIGSTQSSNFPVTNDAYDISYNGEGDVFIAKLDSSGSRLIYATYLGGTRDDAGMSIAIDSERNAYITGFTISNDFPVSQSAFDRNYTGTGSTFDAFAAKLDSSGKNLVYSTYLGGSQSDFGYGIGVDADGHAIVTGETHSSDLPTTAEAYNTIHNGEYDVFVTKFNFDGSGLVYSTFVGGASFDIGHDIMVDMNGHAFVTGYTFSSNFPLTSGLALKGFSDVFVLKMNPVGSDLIFSSVIGGAKEDYGYSIAFDATQAVYIAGSTGSSDFPTTAGAFDNTISGARDGFLAALNGPGDWLLYSTFLGGGGIGEWIDALAVDKDGNLVAVGETSSSDFPVTDFAFQRNLKGSPDIFVTKLLSPLRKKDPNRRQPRIK